MVTDKRNLAGVVYFLPVPVIMLSLLTGPSDTASIQNIIHYFYYYLKPEVHNESSEMHTIGSILWDVRLPRILLAFMVGGALSVSGSGLQAVFRNPLVSPYVLGLSSGAAFGAAFALALGILPVQVSAFLFGLLAVIISYSAALKHRNISIVSLILSGVIVSGIFTALLTLVQFLSDPFRLQSIVHWTMGNFHHAGWNMLTSAILPMVAGIFILMLYRWRINVIALGDDEARSSGIHPVREKIIILAAATLASSAAVSVAGIIGLYGLIIPHMVRMLFGPDHRRGMMMNFLIGGTFLLIIDDISRTVAGFEIPIGVITMLIGAPFFLFLLKKSNTGWEQ